MGAFVRLQRSHLRARTAGGGNSPESAPQIWRKDDVAVVAPACSTAAGSVAQGDCGATLHRNLLELAIGEESYRFSVRRKERIGCILRAAQRCKLALIQQASVEERLAVRAPQPKSQTRPIRGKR